MTEVKFCGLMRAEDAELGASLGARWLGVIFAGGPRRIAPEIARELFASVPPEVRRVGVFGAVSADEIARTVERARLDVAQLHGDPDAAAVNAVRALGVRTVWAVARVAGATLPEGLDELFDAADAVVLDAKVEGALGGTGRRLDWAAVREPVSRLRGETPVVLAGGLTPDTVGAGVVTLGPDIVDVSSGVEHAPGVKDPARMRAFIAAVRAAG